MEKLPRGQHVLVSSTTPLRTESVPGHPMPVSLALRDDGEGYVPANPLVPLAISKHAKEGIAFPSGLRVTPVSAATAETPAVVGNSVVFANASSDTDLIEEPLPNGAEMSWQLRSQDSSPEQGLRFVLPPDASLRASRTRPGGAEVREEGRTVLRVAPASAEEADGQSLATSYSISGDVLTTHVDLSGNVDFPVLLDPAIYPTYYGESSGGGSWAGWEHYLASGYGLAETSSELEVYANEGEAYGSYGSLYISPPGPLGLPGSAGVTRVNLYTVGHGNGGQSDIQGEIVESNGTKPAYSIEPNSKEYTTEGPLDTPNSYVHQTIAFCAQEANGSDKEEEEGKQPLCNEVENQGKYFFVNNIIDASPRSTVTSFTSMKEAEVIYRDPTGPNRVVLNHPGYEGQWLKTAPTNWTIEAEDEGMGLDYFELYIPAGNPKGPYFQQKLNCVIQHAKTECPKVTTSEPINLSKYEGTGVFYLSPAAADVTDNVTEPGESAYVPLYLDQTPPVVGELTGTLAEAAGHLIGDGNYTLNYSAEDGSREHPQSGVKAIEVKVDGKLATTTNTTCPEPKTDPSEGCYGLSGSWTMTGQSYGAGSHTISVIAHDWAGNLSEKSITVTVNEAAYEPVGPGAVNLQTGDFKLTATDVSLSGGTANLSVSRTYDSRNLTQGANGPLGPEWALTLPDTAAGSEWQSLEPQSNGSVTVFSGHNNEITFTPKSGGGYTSPPDFQADTLTEPSTSPAEYEITNANGDYTTFKQLESTGPFLPTGVAEATAAGGLNKVHYTFTKASEGIFEPTEVIGPEPSEGACTAKLVQGCRALTFKYATATSAGEGPTEWGEYKGRLSQVLFTAWEPVKGEMSQPIVVAQYAYDAKGRLRAEWDPRLSSEHPLKTTYGYDAESHVTAISPPGEEPWLLHYGQAGNDLNTGRLLSVSRLNAETPLWNGEPLKNTATPTLSTDNPVAGTALNVTNGSWNTTAVAYSYQWELCNFVGQECFHIAGAASQTYTPLSANVGRTIAVQVTATNAAGSVTATTAASNAVNSGPLLFSQAFGSYGSGAGQLDEPTAVALTSRTEGGSLWVADGSNHRIDQFTGHAKAFAKAIGWGVADGKEELEECTTTCKAGIPGFGLGQLSDPEGIGVAKGTDNIVVADDADDRVVEYNIYNGNKELAEPEVVRQYGSYGSEPGKFYEPHGIALTGTLTWVADTHNCRVELFREGNYKSSFGKCGSKPGEFEDPVGVTYLPPVEPRTEIGDLYVTNVGHGTVEEFNENGEFVREFGKAGSGQGEFNAPWAITADPANRHIYVSSYGNDRVEVFTAEGQFVEQIGHYGSESEEIDGPSGLAVTEETGALFIADEYNDRIDEWKPTVDEEEPVQPAPNPGTTSVTTIDYHVPVSGTGAPYALGAKEDEAWAQTDVPQEATAIFPPSEPQGWPASEYKHADVFYMDSANRTVNTVSPGGAIATTQYVESTDNVARTLTPDNQAKIVAQGLTATALNFYTENTYNAAGTQLTSTLGPQHKVKEATGTEVEARKHTRYYYEEGAPAGGPYNLVTKTIESLYRAGSDSEERTVKNSYSGSGNQENLGWKLHASTATESSNGHETLTTTTSYEPTTGEIKETQTPVGSNGDQAMYRGEFGAKGEGNGQFLRVGAIAQDSKGNLWAADRPDNRIEKFSETGEYLKEFKVANGISGIAVNSKGDVLGVKANGYILEYNESGTLLAEFSKRGTGNGELKEAEGIALDAHGDMLVTDEGNKRVEEFNEAGEFVRAFGKGSSEGALEKPNGIAVDSHGHIWVTDRSRNCIVEYTETGGYIRTFGKGGTGNGELSDPTGITVDPEGDVWVIDTGNDRVEEFNEEGKWESTFGSPGSGTEQFAFELPAFIVSDAKHDLWVGDTNNWRIQRWFAPNPTAGNSGARTTQTIYYTSAVNESYPECGKHAEWAGLPCQEQYAAQPESGLPKLPVTTYTYNIWDEPLTTTDSVGAGAKKATRTTTLTYDAAGRPLTSAISATEDKAVPTVTNEYSGETGLLIKQSTSSGSITSEYNKLGELTSYKDATGNVTTYKYEHEKEARLIEVVDGEGTAAASTQTYGYSATTGFLTSLKDSAAGTFTASYDVEGDLTTEGYPNGMNANYTHNEAGEPTGLEYVKTTHCTTGCTWYTDSVVPSIRGQWVTQTSTLGKDSYYYDSLNRLTEAQETPTGKGCTTRLYAYDEDGNRTSLTTREPGSEGKCVTEGGTSQSFSYDTANRLDESGISYDEFGNITSLPAADAGGTTLTSTYYVNNALATQEQNGVKIGYSRDPVGRVNETVTNGTETVTSHYEGPGNTPAWTITSGGSWTRNIDGPQGALAAIQTNGETPVLQLADLHGDIIGTAADSETESKFTAANETSEYGVPRTTVSEKYAWLGAEGLATELPTGIISMGARTYVPQIGRFLQADPVPGGSVNSYAYTDDDPVNSSDPTGEYTSTTTYNYEAIEAGTAAAGLPEDYEGPGAILPAPVNMQIEEEFVSHPPWDAASAYENEVGSEQSFGGGGQVRIGGVLFFTAPYDGSPNVQSECNKSGQNCSGCRSGGKRNKKGECQPGKSSNEGLKSACAVAGVFISLASFPESVPANVAKAIAAGGAGAAAACRLL